MNAKTQIKFELEHTERKKERKIETWKVSVIIAHM